MRRLPVAALLVTCSLLPFPVHGADDPLPAVDFVRQVGRDIAQAVGGAGTVDVRRARLMPVVARVVDIPAVARFCLGRYWSRSTPEQQQEYQAVFQSVLVNTIATWSGRYASADRQTVSAFERPIAESDGTHVPTTVRTGGGPTAHVTWIVDMNATPPKLLDVVAAGLSLRVTLRSDYVAYLGHHDGNVQAFIATLRQHAGDASGNPFAGASPNHP